MSKKLSLDETKSYLIRFRECGDKESFAILVERNQGLVKYIAYKKNGNGLTFDELVSAGNEGLVKAILKFDYINKPMEIFPGYIAVSIERKMVYDIKKNNKYSTIVSFDEPIGSNKDGDDLKLEDILGTDGEELYNNVISSIKIDIVREALKSLTYHEQQLILLRYGLDEKHCKSLTELAEIYGCTQQAVSLQEKKALIKMRHPRNTKKLKDFLDD